MKAIMIMSGRYGYSGIFDVGEGVVFEGFAIEAEEDDGAKGEVVVGFGEAVETGVGTEVAVDVVTVWIWVGVGVGLVVGVAVGVGDVWAFELT
jgi:hypothetical protein